MRIGSVEKVRDGRIGDGFFYLSTGSLGNESLW
jgi:hypothetical protein